MRTEKRIARGAWKYLANGRDTVSVMRFKTPDGSIVDMRGRGVLYSSCDRFIDEVVLQRACFLCGSKPSEVEFNDEHVLPRWLLKKHNLFDQAINLPNLTALKYGQYKTPCCKPCNSYLGRTTEQPIRNALSGGFATLDAHVRTHGTGCLFRWLSLIYLKTHLRDLTLRLDRTGKFLGNIGDDHEWALLHHVHCIVRSELVGANLAPTAFGSLIIISVDAEGFADSYFDFADNHLGRTVLLGTGDVGVVAVMDDSCGVFSVLNTQLATITQSITPLQLRELFAHAAYSNMWLDPRPRSGTSVNMKTGEVTISAECPDVAKLGPATSEGFGEVLEFACRDFIDKGIHPDGRTPAEVRELTRAGRWRFLFTGDGKFISPSPPARDDTG